MPISSILYAPDEVQDYRMEAVLDERRTRSNLEKRYGRKHKTLLNWRTQLLIPRPGKNGTFTRRQVLVMDIFWIGVEVLKVRSADIVKWFVAGENKLKFKVWNPGYADLEEGAYCFLLMQALDSFVQVYFADVTIREYAMMGQHRDSPVVLDLIEIYTRYEQCQRQSKHG